MFKALHSIHFTISKSLKPLRFKRLTESERLKEKEKHYCGERTIKNRESRISGDNDPYCILKQKLNGN